VPPMRSTSSLVIARLVGREVRVNVCS